MSKEKEEKKGRGERQLPANGHNSEKLKQEYMIKLLGIAQKKKALAQEEKDVLDEAKNDGFKKMAMRQALDLFLKSEDQRQAKKETERERDTIFNSLKDLPMFAAALQRNLASDKAA